MEELIDVRSLISKIQSDKQEAIELGVLKKEKKLDDIHKNEIPYSLPVGWEWLRLGDYAFKITDYVASGSFASLKENVLITNEPNYAIMVKTADFSNNFSKNLTYTDEHGYTFLSNSNLFGGELILSNIGSIGKVFIVPNLGVPMTLASNTVMVKMSDKKLIKYLYYFFLSPLGQRTLKNMSSGTSMMKFNKTQLKNIIVPIAPLKQQQNIVQLFDRLSILIENQNTQLKLLDELVKARFVEMFGNPVIGTEKWPIHTVDNVAEAVDPQPSHRTPPIDSDGIPYVSIKDCDLKSGNIDFEGARKVSKNVLEEHLKRYELHDGDFIIGKIGTVGNPIFVPQRRNYALSANVVLVQPNKSVVRPYFLKYSFESEFVERQFNEAKNSTSQAAFGIQKVRLIRVMNPSLNVQDEFEKFAIEIDKSRSRVKKSLEASQELFDSLMQEYFG